MKVIILAGGQGSRLGHLSEHKPKPMIKIGERPILWHIMKIYSSFGYNDFIIALGNKGEIIKDYFKNFKTYNNNFKIDIGNDKIEILDDDNDEKNWKVSLVDTGLNALKGSRLKKLEKYLTADTNMITYGDGVADLNLKDLLNFHNIHGKTLTITGVFPPSRFGEINEKNNQIVSFSEKPQTSSGLINGGFMVFEKKMLDILSISDDCDFEYKVLEELVKSEEVMVYKHKGSWECMDNQRDMEHLNNLWIQKKAFWKSW